MRILNSLPLKSLPCIFVNHGAGPMHLRAPKTDPIKSHLLDVGSRFNQENTKPKSILVVSAHHESSPSLRVSSSFRNIGNDDDEFSGTADQDLAKRVQELLKESNISCELDDQHFLDHGALTPLQIAFPEADVPVTALSLHKSLDPVKHLEIGKTLQPLRDEGVLIMGSGMSYHNLRAFFRPKMFGERKGHDFDKSLTEAITHPDPDTRNELLKNWENFPDARKVHPREEHLMPLFVVAGAAGSDIGKQSSSFDFMGASVSSYSFP